MSADTQQPDVEARHRELMHSWNQMSRASGGARSWAVDAAWALARAEAALAAERQARQDAERERDMEHAKYQDAWAAAHRNAKQRASVEAALDDARRALVKVTQATNLAEAIGIAGVAAFAGASTAAPVAPVPTACTFRPTR